MRAVGSVTIVVGRGRHSEGGVARLRPALRSHIDRHAMRQHMRCCVVEGNDGALRVEWRD